MKYLNTIILITAIIIASGCTLADPRCGNGRIDDGEECDGNSVPDPPTCPEGYESTGFVYQCTDTCSILDRNLEFCTPICGNGKLDDGEECDGTEFTLKIPDCPDGLASTGLKYECTKECKILDKNVQFCQSCGNGILEYGEDCDPKKPDAIAADVCTRLLGPAYQQRYLKDVDVKCDEKTCTVINLQDSHDTVGLCVPWCGNGIIDEERGEECDGKVFKDTPPECSRTEGMEPSGKTYECTPTCQLADKEPQFCQPICGNGKVDPGEECDPGHENAYDKNLCGEGKLLTGDVECSGDCKVSNKADICTTYCGDDKLVEPEKCEEIKGVPYRMNDKGIKEEIKCTDYLTKPVWWDSATMPNTDEYVMGKPECSMCSTEGIGNCRYSDKYSFSGVVSCESIIKFTEDDEGQKTVNASIKMVKNIDADINIYLSCIKLCRDISPSEFNNLSDPTSEINQELLGGGLLNRMNMQSVLLKRIDGCPMSNDTDFNSSSDASPLHVCMNSPKTSEAFKEFSIDLDIEVPEYPDPDDNKILWCMAMYTGQDGSQYICPPEPEKSESETQPKHEKPILFSDAVLEIVNSFATDSFVKLACNFCEDFSYVNFFNSENLSCNNLTNYHLQYEGPIPLLGTLTVDDHVNLCACIAHPETKVSMNVNAGFLGKQNITLSCEEVITCMNSDNPDEKFNIDIVGTTIAFPCSAIANYM